MHKESYKTTSRNIADFIWHFPHLNHKNCWWGLKTGKYFTVFAKHENPFLELHWYGQERTEATMEWNCLQWEPPPPWLAVHGSCPPPPLFLITSSTTNSFSFSSFLITSSSSSFLQCMGFAVSCLAALSWLLTDCPLPKTYRKNTIRDGGSTALKML